MILAALFVSMIALILVGVPIAFAIGASAVATLVMFFPAVNLEIVASRIFFGLDSFLILAVPLFLLLGEVMERAGITDRLVNFAQALVGRWKGGIGYATIVTNIVMSGISGSGAADAAASGTTLVPAMHREGWSKPTAAALVAASSTIGPVIPPSIIMVIYASITNVSVGKLFIAGLIPGLVMGGFLALWVAFKAPPSVTDPAKLPSTPVAVKRASLVLVAPLIVILGIVFGVFTATESAAIACVYAFVLGLGVYRTVRWRDIPAIFVSTAAGSARVMFIVAMASVFSWVMTRAGVGEYVASIPVFRPDAPLWMMLLTMNAVLLVLGCFLDAVAILLIVTPILFPILIKAGVDPVHLGIVMSVNLSIGLITPPFGTSMFVLLGIAKIEMSEFASAVWPLIASLILALGVITYVPEVSLVLPALIQ
jgi:tripartite ATP-independent transporter DctM subunit